MDQHLGIELALLEGMDETLLLKLHEAGVRRRDELESRVGDPARRADLAARLGVPVIRLEAIHHLNFILPEERVSRQFQAERRHDQALRDLKDTTSVLKRVMIGLVVGMAALLVLAVFLRPPRPSPADADDSTLQQEVDALRERMEALAPLARKQAEADLHEALAALGPAPGWSGFVDWTRADHQRLAVGLGDGEAVQRELALSIALMQLSDIERDAGSTLDVADAASAAAALLESFPAVGQPTDLWEAAAMAVRLRLQTRAQGSSPLEDLAPELLDTAPWSWTSPGFLRAELLLGRIEALPLRDEALPLWSETLVALRREADDSRARLQGRTEAWARDYWIRRGELELAVVTALLDKPTMLPYNSMSPERFLSRRRAWLRKGLAEAPPAAKGPLAWLMLEYEEAARLMGWLREDQGRADRAEGRPWLEALAAVEVRRAQEGAAPNHGLVAVVSEALAASGETFQDPWDHARTKREAALRPLLMETRARLRALEQSESTPRTPDTER